MVPCEDYSSPSHLGLGTRSHKELVLTSPSFHPEWQDPSTSMAHEEKIDPHPCTISLHHLPLRILVSRVFCGQRSISVSVDRDGFREVEAWPGGAPDGSVCSLGVARPLDL